jgi:hypothetical protein
MTRVNRNVFNNQTIDGMVDFFQIDGFTRVNGLNTSTVTTTVWFNNVLQPWGLVPGSTVTDGQVASGSVYFNEVVGQSGYYSVRFRPNALGYWRILVVYPTGTQIVSLEYDVVSEPPPPDQGLKAAFVRPC